MLHGSGVVNVIDGPSVGKDIVWAGQTAFQLYMRPKHIGWFYLVVAVGEEEVSGVVAEW